MKFYVLVTEGDVFPVLSKPFLSARKRDAEAQRIRREDTDEDGIYWLNVRKNGTPETGAYTGGFFTEEARL